MRRISVRARLTTAISLVLALLVLSVANVHPVQAQGSYSITVIGIGTAYASPDIATLEIGLEAVGTNIVSTYTKSSDTFTAVTTALAKYNIASPDIQLLRLSITPEDRGDVKSNFTGTFIFRIRSTIRVTVHDLMQIRSLVNDAIAAGANSVDNLVLGYSDLTKVEQQARVAAVGNARERADQLAEALGLSVGDPVSVSETVTSTPPTQTVGIANRGATPLKDNIADNAGQFIVTVQVQVTFSLRTQR